MQFKEMDAIRLYDAILRSKLLNLYCEARDYPYSSLKYHILLTCAFFYNMKHKTKFKNLYLCENLPAESPFQIIYRDKTTTWAILPDRRE